MSDHERALHTIVSLAAGNSMMQRAAQRRTTANPTPPTATAPGSNSSSSNTIGNSNSSSSSSSRTNAAAAAAAADGNAAPQQPPLPPPPHHQQQQQQQQHQHQQQQQQQPFQEALGIAGTALGKLGPDELFLLRPELGDRLFYTLQLEKAREGIIPIRVEITAADDTQRVWFEIENDDQFATLLHHNDAIALFNTKEYEFAYCMQDLQPYDDYIFHHEEGTNGEQLEKFTRQQHTLSLVDAQKLLMKRLEPQLGKLLPLINVLEDRETRLEVFNFDIFFASDTHVLIGRHKFIIWDEVSLRQTIVQLKVSVARFYAALESNRYEELAPLRNRIVKTVLASRYCCQEVRAIAREAADYLVFGDHDNTTWMDIAEQLVTTQPSLAEQLVAMQALAQQHPVQVGIDEGSAAPQS
ncbi:hypothetical protein CAOG_008942 [Capsaspora owczarzaki ATCC 30864]|uniref:Uncharacterized protein n=2 Tax=Capsaspora owczarzaki (strain ATCC 30864) TaxID=595528 RepID=A0A0D2WUK7_CAPO3|nr:hypothetical protein CAOG_008942 [Capsaspora owczarzaki ATCC 30864]